jgi:vesicle-fusing ATPase
VGIQTQGKINSIVKVFNDAYKCNNSLIIIDNIERIIEFVRTGPDFNNNVMQTLFALLNKIPPNPDCKLMVIGTSSNY